MNRWIALLFIVFINSHAILVASVSNPEEYVNILGGTDSHYDLSAGGTLPFITRPWGFNTWAPYTDKDDGGWWFHPSDVIIFYI